MHEEQEEEEENPEPEVLASQSEFQHIKLTTSQINFIQYLIYIVS